MQNHDTVPYPSLPAFEDAKRIVRSADFYEQIKTRRSCRNFADTQVPRAVIENALLVAGTAPSGANHQPWHFAVIGSPEKKRALRIAAEQEERDFYAGKASSEWLDALAPLGTDAEKPYLETAPWLIAIFAQRRGGVNAGDDKQNYYIHESVGIATGFLIAALHDAGLATLTHTPNPMKFLNQLCDRPDSEKPLMLLVVGHPAPGATVPVHATIKKPLEEISSWV
jgi:iodotyrosine deiodinase